MPNILIVDQIVNAGGVERFLQGILPALQAKASKDLQFTVLLNYENSAKESTIWAKELHSKYFRIHFLFEDLLSQIRRKVATPKRIFGIPGTTVTRNWLPEKLKKSPNKKWKALGGDLKSYIENFVEKGNYDLVYFGFPYSLECPDIDTPFVITPHDFAFKRTGLTSPGDKERIEQQMPKWLARANRIIVSSDFIKEEIRVHYPHEISKVEVVRLGIPEGGEIPTIRKLNEIKKKYNLPEKFILNIGWITPHKNQIILFKALALLKRQGLFLPLVLAGPNSKRLTTSYNIAIDPYVYSLRKEVEKMGLIAETDFHALGFLENSDIDCLYQLASGIVMPSFYEAGSFPSREAMRAGCPVVCSKIPAHEEETRLLEGQALLFNPEDEKQLAEVLRRFVQEDPALPKMGKFAQKKVTTVFSWEKTAEGYLDAFKRVILKSKVHSLFKEEENGDSIHSS